MALAVETHNTLCLPGIATSLVKHHLTTMCPCVPGCPQVEFPRGYEAAAVSTIAKDQLKYGADYLIKAHNTPTTFVVQVGSPTRF